MRSNFIDSRLPDTIDTDKGRQSGERPDSSYFVSIIIAPCSLYVYSILPEKLSDYGIDGLHGVLAH